MTETAPRGVKGSFDHPPIIVVSSIEKTLWMLLVSAVFLCISYLFIATFATNTKQYIGGYSGIFVFGIGVCFAALRLILPGRLVISPQGVDFSYFYKKWCYAWPEILEITTYRVSPFSNSLVVGFTRAGRDREVSVSEKLMKGRFGVHVAFGTDWPMSAPELADLLNSAKNKWGKDSDAGLISE